MTAARSALLLATVGAMIAVCGRAPEAATLPAGEWTGDLTVPSLPAALGLLAHVSHDGSVLDLDVFEGMGFDGGGAANLRIAGGGFAFSWTSEHRECRLDRTSDGAYAGDCTRAGSPAWRLRLAPPALRALPVGYARSILARGDRRWTTREHRRGRLHVADSLAPTLDLEARAETIGAAVSDALALLGESDYDRPLDAFLVHDREEIRALTGSRGASLADPHGSTVLLAGHGAMETVVRHEVMHVLSLNLWGVPGEPAGWAREGIATWAGGGCAGYGVHQLAASLAETERLLSLPALIDDFYAHDDVVTYLQSASLFRYVYETYGREFARAAWTRGLRAALDASGGTLDNLERDWLATIRDPALAAGLVDWVRLEGGCG